jgi:hypothetical protein
MLATGCVAPPNSGMTTNPFTCAGLDMPYFGTGDKGWHINLGWLADHPIITFVVIAVVLTIARSVTDSRMRRQSW